jgi:hypothetical protein
MALANGVRFIWLDTYIGQNGEYDGFKRMFRTALEPTTTMPPDAIDSLIRALNENVAPFLFADTPDKAIELIESHHDKKIIFISSGSLGQHIIPLITETYPYVHSFYFFCAVKENYVDFAYDYLSCLQIFDFELDLLARLARDISKDIIQQGEVYMRLNEPKNAWKCFENARILNMTANASDTFNTPFYGYLRMLNGFDGNIGLIRQAEDMLNQQPSNENTQQPQPPEENQQQSQPSEEDEQLSQQETESS